MHTVVRHDGGESDSNGNFDGGAAFVRQLLRRRNQLGPAATRATRLEGRTKKIGRLTR